MASIGSTLLIFVISLIVSTLIIYIITKLFGEKEGIGTAFFAAIIGTVIYTIIYSLIGQGWIAAIVAGIVWLLALQFLYKIGWLKSLAIAVVVWIATTVVGLFLPTLTGPV
jgi:hypothetical protein